MKHTLKYALIITGLVASTQALANWWGPITNKTNTTWEVTASSGPGIVTHATSGWNSIKNYPDTNSSTFSHFFIPAGKTYGLYLGNTSASPKNRKLYLRQP